MKKVAVFGNAGGGKSTLAKQLAAITGLPLHALDKIKYRDGGGEVPQEEYLKAHAELLKRDQWIIDGFGCLTSVWVRFSAADTLIYIDLPLVTHFLWVTKRLLKGLFVTSEGWPENSPIVRGSMNSYRVLWPCHSRLTPKYRAYLSEVENNKKVYHLRSAKEMSAFLESVQQTASMAYGNAAQ